MEHRHSFLACLALDLQIYRSHFLERDITLVFPDISIHKGVPNFKILFIFKFLTTMLQIHYLVNTNIA